MVRKAVKPAMFKERYGDVFQGDPEWREITVEGGLTYGWDARSTYVQNPPYFAGMSHDAGAGRPTSRARASSACSSTRSPPTTSRRPASIKRDSPAGQLPDRARRRRRTTSTPTARGAAITR